MTLAKKNAVTINLTWSISGGAAAGFVLFTR
jgi:hypothetical protein